MPQTDSMLEWQTVLDNADWARDESLDQLLGTTQPPDPELPGKCAIELKRVIIEFSLVAALLGGLLVWNQVQKEADRAETEAGEIVELKADLHGQEEDASDQENRYVYAQPNIVLSRSEADLTRMYSNLAIVQVTASDAMGDAYRETHFYRQEAGEWLPASPPPEMWGREQTLMTPHFRIHYRQADAKAVAEAAPLLDTIYADLRKDLGLPDRHDPLTIEVAPQAPAEVGFLSFYDDRLLVSSPLLVPVPADLSDGELLVRLIAYPLVEQVWIDILYPTSPGEERHNIRPGWSTMVRGLQTWQAYASDDSRERWDADVIAWMHQDAPAIRSGQRAPSTLDLELLCRENVLWRYSAPPALSLTLLCTDPNWREQITHISMTLAKLGDLIGYWDLRANPAGPWYREGLVRSMAASTVIEYFVRTYGRDQLPLLVEGLRTHDRWETLIPDVLGVSAQEFEAGWQEYLAEEYGWESGESTENVTAYAQRPSGCLGSRGALARTDAYSSDNRCAVATTL